MAPTVRILDITAGSDGDGRKWPKHHYTRNDEYFKERIATDKWIKDLPGGAEPGVVYRLNKLPNGYAGFERARPDSKHIDRYVYGHPNGQFRSLNEFYPHFKHLMDYGGPVGCTCKNCLGGDPKKKAPAAAARRASRNDSERSHTPPQRSRHFAQQTQHADPQPVNLISPYTYKSRGGPIESEWPLREERKLVDHEGTADIYELLISKLKEADRKITMRVTIEETSSPDWRSSHTMTAKLLNEWQDLSRYAPRIGEVVLFVRTLDDGPLIWDKASQTFCYMDTASKRPTWEAGVVTQMPQEVILDKDLVTDDGKEQAVNYSGFRIEPLSEPGNDHKPYTRQHKHVPLHAIRPFALWTDCLNGVPEEDWHATIKHAMMISSSVCVVGRERFVGHWPNATVFCRGLYVGAELIMLGDAVRLLPVQREQKSDSVTDIMVVDRIRLRFVNLDTEEDDTAPDEVLPYQSCIHISGRVYTLDSTRSFDGVGKLSVDPTKWQVPEGIVEYGTWYYYVNPSPASTKVEVPFTRILGRCVEHVANEAWYGARPVDLADKKPTMGNQASMQMSRGLSAVREARQYSQTNDKRITQDLGTTWYWADTRIEQLDLHEVNGRFVGVKEAKRTPEEMRKWRTALKAVDGKKGAFEEYEAAAKEALKVEKVHTPSSKAYGMVASSRQFGTESPSASETEHVEEEEEEEEEEDDEAEDAEGAMDLDNEHELVRELEHEQSLDESSPEPRTVVHKHVETIELYDTDEEDEEESNTNRLAEKLAAHIRPGDPRMR